MIYIMSEYFILSNSAIQCRNDVSIFKFSKFTFDSPIIVKHLDRFADLVDQHPAPVTSLCVYGFVSSLGRFILLAALVVSNDSKTYLLLTRTVFYSVVLE